MNNRVEEVGAQYLVEHALESGVDEGNCEANPVPMGYKQTEVGVIPEDWECSNLADIFSFKQGVQVPVDKQNKSKNNGFVRFIRIVDLTNDHEPLRYVADPGRLHHVGPNDLFMVRYGIPGFVGFGYSGVIANNLFRLIPKAKIQASFYLHYLKFRHLDILEMSGSSTMPAISFVALSDFKVVRPKVLEQTAIANALSDVDALISNLESLIAKKQAIKTATMQQLLTGRTRLPQFALREDGSPKGYKQSELGEVPEDWEVVTISEATRCLDNLRIPLNESQRSRMHGDIPYCGANGIVGWVNDYVIDDDIILMAEDGGYFDEYALRPIAYRIIGKCWVNNHAHILQAIDCFDQSYIFYCLVHKDIQKYLASGTRAKLNKSEMEKIEIISPDSKEEQTAIATILSDMDQEIQTLEQRLNKTRQIKQGMMQQLLTGKVRLVKPEADAQ